LNPEPPDRLGSPCVAHPAFDRSVAAPDVAPFLEPSGRTPVVRARSAPLTVARSASAGARSEAARRVDRGVVGLLREQRVGQDTRRDRPSLLSLVVIVLTLGPLNDLVRRLIEVETGAAR